MEAIELDNGLTIHIHADDSPESPREWDNLGRMVCWHSRYKLGDEHTYTCPADFALSLLRDVSSEVVWADLRPGISSTLATDDARADWRDHCAAWSIYSIADLVSCAIGWLDDFARYNTLPDVSRVLANHYMILPLYLYDHSGLSMSSSSFACPRDSGQVGYIYVSHAKLRGECGDDWLENGTKCLQGEVDTYDQYLRGDVYGYDIVDSEGNSLDSCWGFFGYDFCESEARSAADGLDVESFDPAI